MFDENNTTLPKYKTGLSEWSCQHVSHRTVSHWTHQSCVHKKINLQKNKKIKSKNKTSLEKRKQPLVTCIQLATEHIRDQKDRHKKIQVKKGMFTASSRRIKLSMTGGKLDPRSSSQSPEKHKQRNMRRTDLVHFRKNRRRGDLGKALQFSTFHYFCTFCGIWKLGTTVQNSMQL